MPVNASTQVQTQVTPEQSAQRASIDTSGLQQHEAAPVAAQQATQYVEAAPQQAAPQSSPVTQAAKEAAPAQQVQQTENAATATMQAAQQAAPQAQAAQPQTVGVATAEPTAKAGGGYADGIVAKAASGGNQITLDGAAAAMAQTARTPQRKSEKAAKQAMHNDPTKYKAADPMAMPKLQNYSPKLEQSDVPVNNKGKSRRITRTQTTKKGVEIRKEQAKAATHQKTAMVTGSNLITKLVAKPNNELSVIDVSIGSNVILEAVRQPGCALLQRVNEAAIASNENTFTKESYLKDNWSAEDFNTSDALAAENMARLAQQINRMNLMVTMTKSPVSEAESIQARKLRIHTGDGIAVHPLAVKGFNADFDGDEAGLHLDAWGLEIARNAMAYLIGADGKTKLDGDFLPPIQFEHGTSEERDAIREAFKGWFNGVVSDTKELANAYIDYLDNAEESFALTGLVQDIARIVTAEYSGNLRYEKLAQVVDTLYEHMNEIRRMNAISIAEESKFEPPKKEFEELNKVEAAVLGMVQDARAGKLPASYQQFIADCGYFQGDVEGKNTHFRVGANIAKLIKRSERTYIGEEGLYELWHTTAMGLQSIAMNSKIFAGERNANVWEDCVNRVSRECGFPGDSGLQLDEWFVRFARSWNNVAADYNVANVGFTTSWDPVEGNKKPIIPIKYVGSRQTVAIEDVIKPFMSAYSGFTLGRIAGDKVFFGSNDRSTPDKKQYESWRENGNYIVMQKHKHEPLYKFANNNHLRIRPNVRKGNITTWDVLIEAIADTKTGAANAYEKSITQCTEELVKLMTQWEDVFRSDASEEEYNDFVESATTLATGTHPSLFAYFNLDNPAAFANSKYGQAMIRDPQNAAGVRMAMVYEWRLARIKELNSRLKDADPFQYDEIKNQILAEKSILASSSDVWAMLVHEMLEGPTNFERYLSSRGVIYRKKLDGSMAKSKADEIGFFDAYQNPSWTTIADFIADLEVPYEYKKAVLCDMVLNDGGFISTQPFEIEFQLELDPIETYVGINAAGYEENQGNPLKASIEQLRRFNKQAEREQQNKPYEAEDVARNIEGFRSDPLTINHVPPEIWGDMVLACMEKGSEDGEKAHQTTMTNAGYQAINLQTNGCLLNETYYTDSALQGKVPIWMLSHKDIVEVLSGMRVIEYFDEQGRPGTLDFRGLPAQQITEFLNENPKIAGHIMNLTSVDILPNSEGTAKLVVRGHEAQSLSETLLSTKVSFSAMCALFTPSDKRTMQHTRPAIITTRRKLANYIQDYAAFKLANKDKRYDLRSEPWVADLNNLLDSDRKLWGMDELNMNLGYEIADLIEKYSQMLIDEIYVPPSNKKPSFDFKFTKNSADMFYDVRQMLVGSKTETSTGVEGSITERNKIFQAYLSSYKNRWRFIDELTPEEQERLMQSDSGARIVNDMVYDPEYEEDDPTLDIDGKQVTAAAYKLMAIRSLSGEDHNLKLRKAGINRKDKWGDDITRKPKFHDQDSWYSFEADMQSMYETDGLGAVQYEYAIRMQKAEIEFGYEPLTIPQLMSVAELCVIEDGTGGIVFRSLEQLSTAINTRFYEDPNFEYDLDNMTDEQAEQALVARCEEIMRTVGTARNGQADGMRAMRNVRVPGFSDGRVKTALRKRASSLERNMQLLNSNNNLVRASSAKVDEIDNQMRDRYEKFDTDEGIFIKSLDDAFKIMGINSDITPASGRQMIVYVNDKDSLANAFETARINMMTLVFPKNLYNADLLGEYAGNVDLRNGNVWLSFFDAEQNGYGNTQFSQFWLPRDVVTWTVEDPYGLFDYGDASMVGTKHFGARTHVSDESVTFSMPADALFGDSMNGRYAGYDVGFRIATPNEIRNITINDLDLRVARENSNSEKILAKYDLMLKEFLDNWDGESQFLPESKPDRIIGFACCGYRHPETGLVEKVYAPLIPWENNNKQGRFAPASFNVIPQMTRYNNATGCFDITVVNNATMENRWGKVHEGDCAANKGIVFGDYVDDVSFANGVKIDLFNAEQSTAGRIIGDNKRIFSLKSLLYEFYTEDSGFSYNAADDAEFMTGNPLKLELAKRPLTDAEWLSIDKFYDDAELDAFCKTTVKKLIEECYINPTPLFAHHFTSEDGRVIKTRDFFELEALMETTYTWEDVFLKFIAKQCPELVPAGLNAKWDGQLYRVCKEGGWNYGCLQKWVEVPGQPGTGLWMTARAHLGMYGEDSSAWKRAGYNGAALENQALLISTHSGKRAPGSFKKYMRYALAGSAPRELRATSKDVLEFGWNNEKTVEESIAFRGSKHFLSNTYESTVTINDITYPTAENAFQAMKTFFMDDKKAALDMRKRFANISWQDAKKEGRHLKIDVNKWNKKRVDAMFTVVNAKFQQDSELMAMLMQMSDEDLVEVNPWGDTFWGVNKHGKGENNLGRILMQIRDDEKNYYSAMEYLDIQEYENMKKGKRKVDWTPDEAVCFTGHRPNDSFGYDPKNWRGVYNKVLEAINDQYNKGKRVFIHGGAQGLDQIAARAVLRFKEDHPDVRSIMAVPFEAQSTPWRRFGDDGFFGHNEWMKLREQSETFVLYDDPANDPDSAKKLNQRNDWMIDHSSAIIAMWNGKTSGGTYNAMSEAKKRGHEFVNVLENKKDKPKPTKQLKKLNAHRTNTDEEYLDFEENGYVYKDFSEVNADGPYEDGDHVKVHIDEPVTRLSMRRQLVPFDFEIYTYDEVHGWIPG